MLQKRIARGRARRGIFPPSSLIFLSLPGTRRTRHEWPARERMSSMRWAAGFQERRGGMPREGRRGTNEQGGKCLARNHRGHTVRARVRISNTDRRSDRGDCSPGIRTTWLSTNYDPARTLANRVDRTKGQRIWKKWRLAPPINVIRRQTDNWPICFRYELFQG